MKLLFLIAIPFLVWSCVDNKKNSENTNSVSTIETDDLEVGGLYLCKNRNNTYYLTKILVLDDYAVHLRTYSDTFQTKPASVNSENLKILIGHSPIDKSGFLIDNPELIKVEEVKESELEGYKIYLEAMSK